MATISPDILARLQSPYYSGFSQQQVFNDPNSGLNVQARWQDPTYMGEGAMMMPSQLTGYTVGNYTPAGGNMSVYDLAGRDTGQSEQWKADDWNYDTLAMLAAAGFLGGTALAGGLGGAAAGAEGLNPAMWGDAGMMYGGADAAAAGSLGGGASLSSVAPLTAGGAAPGLLSQIGDAVKSVVPSGAGSLLGPIATIGGALAGAQGQNESSNSTREPWGAMQPLLKDQLIPAVGNLLGFQMDYLPQQSKQLNQQAMGLLSTPMAGNGVSQFNQRYHFGG